MKSTCPVCNSKCKTQEEANHCAQLKTFGDYSKRIADGTEVICTVYWAHTLPAVVLSSKIFRIRNSDLTVKTYFHLLRYFLRIREERGLGYHEKTRWVDYNDVITKELQAERHRFAQNRIAIPKDEGAHTHHSHYHDESNMDGYYPPIA